jgi:hypothetical protein
MEKTFVVERSFRFGLLLIVVLLFMVSVTPVRADTLTIGGVINQSVQDGTGPAENNPDLNHISDGDFYTVSFSFTGSVTSPGLYQLTGLSFSTAGGVVEKDFSSGSLLIAQSGASSVFSLFGCLLTGSACNQGNELDLNFLIQSADLNANNAVPLAIAGLLPLDLLEDDGVTDIHGTVTRYSNSSVAAVPEPSSFLMLWSGAASLGLLRTKKWFGKRITTTSSTAL